MKCVCLFICIGPIVQKRIRYIIILQIILHRCQASSITLSEEHKLYVRNSPLYTAH